MYTTNRFLSGTGMITVLLAATFQASPVLAQKGTGQSKPVSASSAALTPEGTLRTFFMAMFSQDEKTLRSVTLPVSETDFAYLVHSEPVPAEMQKKLLAQIKATPIKAMKVGDTLDLPSGKTLTVLPGMVSTDRALLLPQSFPLPLPMQKVKGNWRVDASSLIAARKAAERARQKSETATP